MQDLTDRPLLDTMLHIKGSISNEINPTDIYMITNDDAAHKTNQDLSLNQLADEIQRETTVLKILNSVRMLTSPYTYLRNRLTKILSKAAMVAVNYSPLQMIIDTHVHRPTAYD